jgi:hypothetical protein
MVCGRAVLAQANVHGVVADDVGDDPLVAGLEAAVVAGAGQQVGPELDPFGCGDVVGDFDADPGLLALAQQAGGADGEAVVE